MLKRKMLSKLDDFYNSEKTKALLITGARQVGKTFIIREFGKKYKSFIEINFLENKNAVRAFESATNSKELLFRLSALTNGSFIPGETLVFFDEVQECPEIVTAIKFLVEEGSYRYILSGSLLGVDLKDIRSVPVGYMDSVEMYPLDFEEFCTANGVSENILYALKDCFLKQIPVDPLVHDKMTELFKLYIIVGGMPAAVKKYIETNNLREVKREQRGIIAAYKKDIGKYDPQNKLYLEDIFDLIPGELNAKNKRFIMKSVDGNFKFSRFENSFIWLKDAGVALPVFCTSEPTVPLMLTKCKNLFKLFLSDVGLLASMYLDDVQIKILTGEKDVNFGAVYENAAAQELKAHGFDLYYFNSKKQGEVDFTVEKDGDVLPIEIKSGKDYQRHAALNNIMSDKNYGIKKAYVLYNGNVESVGNIIYLPIYMLMFIEKEPEQTPIIYRFDAGVLKN